MKKSFSIFLICLIFIFCAGMQIVPNAEDISGEDYSDITFWLGVENCGGSPCTNYTLGSDDYNAGEDSTLAVTSSAQITSGSAQVGSYGMDIGGAGEFWTMTDSTDGTLPMDSFRIGIYLERVGSPADNATILVKTSGSNYFWIRWQGADDITAYYNDGSNALLVNTATNFVSDGVPVFVEVALNISGGSGTLEVFGNGSSQGSDSGTITETANGEDIDIGNVGANAATYYLDQIIISNNYTRDLNALKGLTTSPR